MEDGFICEVCGNEGETQASQCPFCGSARTSISPKKETPTYRVINLEKGMPVVRDALKRLHNELESSRLLGHRVLVVIHGYGSSGKGGAIRKEVRRQLQYLLDRKEINDFLPGEKCERRSGHFRQMTRRFPFMDRLVRKPNSGVTIVVL